MAAIRHKSVKLNECYGLSIEGQYLSDVQPVTVTAKSPTVAFVKHINGWERLLSTANGDSRVYADSYCKGDVTFRLLPMAEETEVKCYRCRDAGTRPLTDEEMDAELESCDPEEAMTSTWRECETGQRRKQKFCDHIGAILGGFDDAED